jgi:TonB family protein
MAELFRARFRGVEGFQKIVAIKKILPNIAGDEEFLTMFADEAKLAAQLNHPNIVHIFDLGRIESGGYFIAMEHVDGRDLRSILHLARDTGLRVPIPLAVSIAAKIAAALDYAHRRRGDDGSDLHIVHRDVSPPNILVSTDGDIKLCDFGIAKAASKVSRTDTGALKGKVPYMSPEQAWGQAVDQRSDIYSLGAVLFEMLAGHKLFRGDSDLDVLEKVRAGDVVAPSGPNPEVPPALDAVVLKALAREPDGRYAGASDLLRDLEAVLRTYEPAPSSADLAAYVRDLETREAALREARAREALAPPAPPSPSAPADQAAEPLPGKSRRAKPVRVPLPESRQPAPRLVVEPAPQKPAPPPTAPGIPPEPPAAPGIFAGSFPELTPDLDAKKRTRLYVMIAAATVILAVAVWLVVRKPAAAPVSVSAATPLPAPTVAITAEATPLPTAPPAIDQKAIQAEAQRQLATRRRETQRPSDGKPVNPEAAGARVALPTPVARAPAPVTPAPAPPAPEPSPEVKTEAQPARVEPTAVPTIVEPPPAAPVRAPAPAETARGDLVGPGPGVIEPSLVSSPRVLYPPAARQQGISGKVVVLVLVNEEGVVTDAKLQQGVGPRSGINEAVLDAVRHSKFRPATKNGVPVKMWRTVVIDVKP